MSRRRVTMLLAAGALASACATTAPPSGASLSQDDVVDMMTKPRRWDGRTVTVRIYPYDNGFDGSYLVCFEPCDGAYADSSPFIVYTAPGRFSGYRGDRAVVIRARYSSSCFYRDPSQCVHDRFGRLYEVAPQ